MGIESFYGLWLLNSFDERKLGPKVPIQNVSSVFIDCNGIFHRAAQETYYYGAKPWNKEEYEIKRKQLSDKFKSLKQKDKVIFLREYESKHIRKITELLTEITKRFKPSDNLVIVPDGVSNAAKINQQKGRRFGKGSSSDDTILFDSNAITPGTNLMIEIDKAINNWIISQKNYFANGLKIIYSSHMSEGEGEHKIFDYIRSETIKPPTGPSIIYGMDADLIVLSLLCPLENLYLSRENLNKFLSIDALRQELVLKLKDSDQSDEQIIRDFAVMTAFIGNDFVHPLPSFKSSKETLDYFFNIYKKLKLPLSDVNIYNKKIKKEKFERQVRLSIFSDMNALDEVKKSDFWKEKVIEMSKYQFPNLITYLTSNMRLYYDRRSKMNQRSIQLVEGETLENFMKVKEFLRDKIGLDENSEDKKVKFEIVEEYSINITNFMKMLIEYRNNEDTIFLSIIENPPEYPYPELQTNSFNRDDFRTKWYEKEYNPENKAFIEKYYKKKPIFTADDIKNKCLSYIKIIQWVLTYYTTGYKDISHEIFYPYLYSPMVDDVIKVLKLISESPEEIKKEILDVSRKSDEINITPVHQLLSVMPHTSINLIPTEYKEIYQKYLICLNPKSFIQLSEGTDKDFHKTYLIPPIDLRFVNNVMAIVRDEIPKRYNAIPDLIVVNKKFMYSDPKFYKGNKSSGNNMNMRKKFTIDLKAPNPKYS